MNLLVLVLSFMSACVALKLPDIATMEKNSTHSIEVIFGCPQRLLSVLGHFHVIHHHLSMKICNLLRKALRCSTRDYYVHNPHENYNNDCKKNYNATDILSYSITQHFRYSSERAVAFMTANWEADALNIVKQYHFVAVSPKNSIEILSDINKFQKYMESQPLLKSLMPKQYNLATVVYPCVLKLEPVPGGNSKFSFYIKSEKELKNILSVHNQDDEPYVIQEMIKAEYEAVIFFVAYQGHLMELQECRVFQVGKGKLLNTQQKELSQGKVCSTIPGYKAMLLTLTTVVKDLQLDGIGFLQSRIVGDSIKIMELQARIPYGLQTSPGRLSKFIRMYWLAAIYNA